MTLPEAPITRARISNSMAGKSTLESGAAQQSKLRQSSPHSPKLTTAAQNSFLLTCFSLEAQEEKQAKWPTVRN